MTFPVGQVAWMWQHVADAVPKPLSYRKQGLVESLCMSVNRVLDRMNARADDNWELNEPQPSTREQRLLEARLRRLYFGEDSDVTDNERVMKGLKRFKELSGISVEQFETVMRRRSAIESKVSEYDYHGYTNSTGPR